MTIWVLQLFLLWYIFWLLCTLAAIVYRWLELLLAAIGTRVALLKSFEFRWSGVDSILEWVPTFPLYYSYNLFPCWYIFIWLASWSNECCYFMLRPYRFVLKSLSTGSILFKRCCYIMLPVPFVGMFVNMFDWCCLLNFITFL